MQNMHVVARLHHLSSSKQVILMMPAINPGAACIFSKFCKRDKTEERNIPRPMAKCTTRSGPLDRVMAIFVARPATVGGSFQAGNRPKGHKSRFHGATYVFGDVCTDKTAECDIPHPMVKSTAHFGAPKPSYGHFSCPADHGLGKFSSRKRPKMVINCDFPGLRAFSANFARTKTKSAEFRIEWSKYRLFCGP